ncbi:MAG TPA: copper transporter, partial [Armatimonadota bacterium]
MLIDLRQHIITLVAVFLALAVGIVLGSTFINGDSVERKVSGVLEKEFTKLRTENEDQQTRISQLSDQMRRQQEFDRSIAPRLVDRRLVNRSVAIIQTGDYDECVDSVRGILQKAGAEVRSVTVVSPENENTDTKAAMAVRSISGEVDLDKPVTRALEILANSVVTGVNPHAVEVLETKGLIKASGDYSRRTSLVVIVGGSQEIQSDLPSTIDSVLVDKIKAANVLEIVGV